jgi:hypothetical protein
MRCWGKNGVKPVSTGHCWGHDGIWLPVGDILPASGYAAVSKGGGGGPPRHMSPGAFLSRGKVADFCALDIGPGSKDVGKGCWKGLRNKERVDLWAWRLRGMPYEPNNLLASR